MEKLSRDFFLRDTLTVAKDLLGKHLVRVIGGEYIITRIVETEAYIGPEDKGSHSYGGKRTSKNETMYALGGFAYVYIIYGMYPCFNVVTEAIDKPSAVLIRGVEPITGLNTIAVNRYGMDYEKLAKSQIFNLTSGPGKLCKALLIDKSLNGVDMCDDSPLYICDSDYKDFIVQTSPRIGIDYAEEHKYLPWRFYIKDNKFVSKTKKIT